MSTTLLARVLERVLSAISPGTTIVLATELQACYAGVSSGAPQPVTLDVTGSFTVPIGGTLVLKVKKQDPETGDFATIYSDTIVNADGTVSVVIPANAHGITSETDCGTFLLQPSVAFPTGGPRARFFDGKSFKICPTCPG